MGIGSALALLLGVPAEAASPTGGAIAPTAGAKVTWTGTAIAGGAESEASCVEGVSCDTYTLTVSGAAEDWANKKVQVRTSWALPASDYDLFVRKGSVTGPLIGSSASGLSTQEAVFIDPASTGPGTYVVHVVYFSAAAADQYAGSAAVLERSSPIDSAAAGPRYAVYPAPGGIGTSAGEPTLGVDWKTGNVMFIAGTQTLRIGFDDSASPARNTWTNVSAINTSLTTFDPILFTDSDSGAVRTDRTFVSQLLPTKLSLMSFTDDDGESWTPSQGAGINSGVDHQTVGGGPFAPNVLGRGPLTDYPHAVYYASQDVGLAEIALSRDGGLTYDVAVPMWTLAQCSGLHGHIKVARDGTVYVPNKNCAGQQAVAVSTDNGLSWSIRHIPGSTPGENDPSVGIGTDGTIYVGYGNGDGRARVAVSHDRGLSWVNDQDVGASQGVKISVFPAVAAGDSDRAAYFFLGTATAGDGTGTNPAFTGTWYPYIATTYDGGRSWVTVNASPGDPVQRGTVCTNGTTCPSTPVATRNLLDFNDLTIDKKGRPLAAFADGCITAECIAGVDRNGDGAVNSFDNDGAELATVIRQSGGKTLYSAYDAEVLSVPAPPLLVVNLDGDVAQLTWSRPDDGGSALTGYRVYRGNALLATVGPDVNTFSDSASSAGVLYQVSALNANGEGTRSTAVSPTVPESSCRMPGLTVARDGPDTASSVPLTSAVNVKTLSVAEPYFEDGGSRLVFSLKLGGGSLPANSQWYILWNRAAPDGVHDRNYVAMRTDLMGVASFEHGRISYPLVFTSPAANQGNLPTRLGEVQGAYDAQSGTVTFTVDTAKVDGPTAGQTLIGMEARTFLARSDSLPVNQGLSTDFAVGAPYRLVGNLSCLKAPAAPTGLAVSNARVRELALSWTDNASNEDGFHIERAVGSPTGPFVEIASVGANVTSFIDRSVERKVTYFYRVRAANKGGQSGYSNVVGGQRKG